MFSSGVNLGGGGQLGALGDMQLAAAQTSTGKKTFSNSGTDAGFNFGPRATAPTTNLTPGDAWFDAAFNLVNLRIASGNVQIVPFAFPVGTYLANELLAYNSAFGIIGSEFISTPVTKTLGSSGNVATTQTLTVNGAGLNIDFTISSKGLGIVRIGGTNHQIQISDSGANTILTGFDPTFANTNFQIQSADGVTTSMNVTVKSGDAPGIVGNLNLVTGNPSGGTEGSVNVQSRSVGFLSFWGVSPILRPTTAFASATFVANSGTAVNDASTFDGYTIRQLARIIRNLGLAT
jgi:hypothetical protein